MPLTRLRRKTSDERLLRSLVPPSQWPVPNAFLVDTPVGRWLVDLDRPAVIFMVIPFAARKPVCTCDNCLATYRRQTDEFGIPDTFWLRPRGIFLAVHDDLALFDQRAKVSRGLSIALLLMADSRVVDEMCCG